MTEVFEKNFVFMHVTLSMTIINGMLYQSEPRGFDMTSSNGKMITWLRATEQRARY